MLCKTRVSTFSIPGGKYEWQVELLSRKHDFFCGELASWCSYGGGVGPIVLDHYSLSKLVGRSPRSRALNLRLRSSSRRLLHRETYLNLNKNCEPLLVGFNLFCCRSIWDTCLEILCNCLLLDKTSCFIT